MTDINYQELYEHVSRKNAELEMKLASEDSIKKVLRHESRSKLGQIIGLTGLLIDDGQFNQEELEEYLPIIRSCAEELLSDEEAYGKLEKIESGTYTPEKVRFNLMNTLKGSIDRLRINPQFAETPLRYHFGADSVGPMATYVGEEFLVKASFENLLRNSIEATQKEKSSGKSVEDVFFRSYLNNGFLMLDVTNSGTIPSRLRTPDVLFKRGTTEGKHSGSGLGTYILRRFIEAEGGKIDFSTSDEQNKTTFSLSLPVRKIN